MSESLRVLQVEDSISDAARVVRLLKNSGYTVDSERVEDGTSMRLALRRQEWDVVIADNQLPHFDAAGALRILHECGQDVPFIIVSGTIAPERAVEMMRAGAHDYILKDRIERLVPVVQRETRDAQSRRERREAEARLRNRDEWLALVVDVTHLAMFDFYPQSGRVIWTGDVRRHFGLPPDAEITDETFHQVLHPDDRERILDLIGKAFVPQSGGDYAADYRVVGVTDRAERWLSAQGKVFFDSEGKPERFVGVTIDITERKQLEEQFRQAQKLEGVGRLAAGVAHDFNNLLTIISGYSQMTLEQLPPQHPSRGDTEEVLKAAAQAASLTRQLLAFSRRQPSQSTVIVVNELVASTQKMLGRLIDADVKFTLRLDPLAGAIRADAGQLEQVLMNLTVNATDAMTKGGELVIETALRVVDERIAASHVDLVPGLYAAISVSDTGTGISPEVKARMFDPFFTTKQVGKGTGLGLSTVYGIVKQCGGSISVDSELGYGTNFTVLFPSVESPHDKTASLPTASTPAGTETVLLAEDDAGIRRFIRKSLEQYGYRVIECANGMEAMECARQHPGPIHLLLTDGVMPEMGGAELAAQFAVCRPGVPVLCVSGYSNLVWPEVVAEASFLQKPFTSAVLLAKVRALIDLRGTQNEKEYALRLGSSDPRSPA